MGYYQDYLIYVRQISSIARQSIEKVKNSPYFIPIDKNGEINPLKIRDPLTIADAISGLVLSGLLEQKYPHYGLLCEDLGFTLSKEFNNFLKGMWGMGIESLLLEFVDEPIARKILKVIEKLNDKSTAGLNGIEEDTLTIDPLDGTHHFITNKESYGILHSLIHNGKTVVAYNCFPNEKKSYSAIIGEGAMLQHGLKLSKVTVSEIDNPYIARIVLGPRSIDEFVEMSKAYGFDRNNLYQIPGMAAKICGIVEGSYDLYVSQFVPNLWDISPHILLVNEANGLMTDINGHKISSISSVNDKIIVANNRTIQSFFQRIFRN